MGHLSTPNNGQNLDSLLLFLQNYLQKQTGLVWDVGMFNFPTIHDNLLMRFWSKVYKFCSIPT